MSTHRCAAPFCSHVISTRTLFCPHHWGMLPKDQQLAIYRAWNGGRVREDYADVRRRAIAYLTPKGAAQLHGASE